MTRTVEHTRNQALIIWANKAFLGRYGRYVAIRLKGRSLSVAVRHHDMLQWIPAHEALTWGAKPKRWARTGF